MRNIYTITLLVLCALSYYSYGQVTFTDESSLLVNSSFESYQPTIIADMNGDRLDDIVRVSTSNQISIEYQTAGGGTFTNHNFQNPSLKKPWGMCVADVDNNGKNDILAGGHYDGLRIHKENGAGGYVPLVLPGSIFLQGVNFVDINTDGMPDIYACHDHGTSLTYRATTPGFYTLDATMVPSAPYAGNYASVWSDYDDDGDIDLYVSKCRLGVTDSTDPQRINGLYKNNGNGTFTEVGAITGVADGAQSWSADFADIDNDGDMDLFVLNHDQSNRLYEQAGVGSGNFTDLIVGSGISTNGSSDWQSIFADFNNDGFVDLLISGNHYALYLNDGDRTFTQVTNPFPAGTIRNFSVGDLNHDGALDIYATYGSWANSNAQADKILMNAGNSNNFIAFDLQGVQSNINGIGARLELYGSWGMQVREVRSGESYGIMNTFTQHFGIGTATMADSLVIRWPSGIHQTITQIAANQFLFVSEAETLLSVEMLDFNAMLSDNRSVDLKWETASEFNNEWFFIERSTDGSTFEEIGRLQGAGTSNDVQAYMFKDPEPQLSDNYYRLRQLETGGLITYSEVKVVNLGFENEDEFDAQIYPTLAQSGQQIVVKVDNVRSLPVEVSLWNSNGQLVHKQVEQPKSGEITYIYVMIPGQPGTYVVRVTDEVEHVVGTVIVTQ
ncbi:MAG: CRTAC1 family protein [Bacteroidota bacterium]